MMCVAVSLVLQAASLSAQDSLPDPADLSLTPGERLEALLQRIQFESSRRTTLEADFVQHKESSFLLESQVAHGSFAYSIPDRVRWDYESPDPISLVVVDGLMTTWFKDLDLAERMRVGKQSQQVLRYLGAGTSIGKLMEHFRVELGLSDITDEPYHLKMTPRYPRIAKRVASMSFWVDPELFVPVRLRYVEPDGDVTEYSFENLRINEPISDDRFVVSLPPEIEVREVDLTSKLGGD